jgi:hypothetical protein
MQSDREDFALIAGAVGGNDVLECTSEAQFDDFLRDLAAGESMCFVVLSCRI